MLNIVKTRNIWFVISSLVVLAGIAAIVVYGLRLGIDFRGGALAEVRFVNKTTEAPEVQDAINSLNLGGALVQKTEQNTFNLRLPELTQEQHDDLLQKLGEKFDGVEELGFRNIGPTISKEITRRAFYQLIMVSLGILAYIAWAFRRVPKPLSSWRFGWAAIIALIHDLLVVVGVFAILGRIINVELDALFVTALLTVLGFSVHDTIVVFDRIRENLRRSSAEFSSLVNASINETLVRSINTSSTVVFVLLALLLFGGETIKFFVLALLVGIVAGTYSSIFIASPLLYVFHRKRLEV